jgi:hypothetical protein
MKNDLTIAMRQFGPGPAELARLGERVLKHATVRKALGRARHRLLSVEMIDPAEAAKSRTGPRKPDAFRATIYDYTTNRTLLVESRISAPAKVAISESAAQPPLSPAEWDEAVRIVREDGQFAGKLEPAGRPAVRQVNAARRMFGPY